MTQCKKNEAYGKGIGFTRIRRITGYLVGTTDRFNTAKKAELSDRVSHMSMLNKLDGAIKGMMVI